MCVCIETLSFTYSTYYQSSGNNKLVYWFFLRSIIYSALFFFIEHYLVAIRFLRKLYVYTH